jgi:hypothetical protein
MIAADTVTASAAPLIRRRAPVNKSISITPEEGAPS